MLDFSSFPVRLVSQIRVLIAGIWLLIGIATLVRIMFAASAFLWYEILWGTALSGIVTAGLLYFSLQFKRQIFNTAREDQKLFKKNPHPMWVYDLKSLRFLIVNDAALSMYGYTEEDFLSMTIKDIRPAEDVPALITQTEKIKLNFNLDYHWSGTWRHRKKSGERMYVEISSHEIIYEGKKAELVLAYNVTEKVRQDLEIQALNRDLERNVIKRTNDLLQLNKKLIEQNRVVKSANLELFIMTKQLQEANRKIQEHADMKNKFISMASHEFRTPLASINLMAGHVKRYHQRLTEEVVITKMKGIEDQVLHMTYLLDDVLTIGKSDSNVIDVKIEPVDLRGFVTRIAEDACCSVSGGAPHRIIVSIGDDVPDMIHSDEKFLRNIFINLLTNAIKYSPGRNSVYLDVYKTGETICFDVRDEGLGISPTDVTKIFEPFYRTDSSKAIQGTGLGLAIVKKAVELINGEIGVESSIDSGSIFSVRLPAFPMIENLP